MNQVISQFLGVYKHYALYSQKPLFMYLLPKEVCGCRLLRIVHMLGITLEA